jgi:hypothetical protein
MKHFVSEFLATAEGLGPRGKELLGVIDENIVPANLNRERFHAHSRVIDQFSRRHVVLPAMPRAGDDRSIQLAFAQRPAAMQAYVIDST